VSRRSAAEFFAHQFQRNDNGYSFAEAVRKARSLFVPHLFRHIFATASHAATAPLLMRSFLHPRVHLQSAMRPIDRCCRHILSRVLLCRSGTRNEGGPTRFVVTRTELRMHCECAFPPTQPDLTRGVSGPTSPGGDEGGAFPRGACQGGRWRPRVHTGVPVASEPPAARAPFWGLLVSETDFRAFPAVEKKCMERPEIRCAQLAAIKREAAVAALVVDVTAKNLEASTVDLLLSVKVRCRRCAPLSALGRRSIPRSAYVGGST
jgi:hypothetical protein